jgi:isoleucyl-tRNA synthetase
MPGLQLKVFVNCLPDDHDERAANEKSILEVYEKLNNFVSKSISQVYLKFLQDR